MKIYRQIRLKTLQTEKHNNIGFPSVATNDKTREPGPLVWKNAASSPQAGPTCGKQNLENPLDKPKMVSVWLWGNFPGTVKKEVGHKHQRFITETLVDEEHYVLNITCYGCC